MSLSFPNIDPVAISLGPFDVRWYALAYLAGFLLGWKYIAYLCRRFYAGIPNTPADKDSDDLLMWIVLGVIVGGRIGYVLFYQFELYAAQPLDALKLWQGGMSFHGGLLGVIAATFLYARAKSFDFLRVMDLLACAAPIGLFFGRAANFINGELYGRVTSSPLGMIFPSGGPYPRHPSQLYEAVLEGLVVFIVLFVAARRGWLATYKGLCSGLFLMLYGVFRFGIEFFRQPDRQLGFIFDMITMGQILCLPMIAGGAFLIWLSVARKKA